jgi:hypothetical protein
VRAAECVLFGFIGCAHRQHCFSRRSFLLSVVSPDSALLAPPMIPLTRRLAMVRLLFSPAARLPISVLY